MKPAWDNIFRILKPTFVVNLVFYEFSLQKKYLMNKIVFVGRNKNIVFISFKNSK